MGSLRPVVVAQPDVFDLLDDLLRALAGRGPALLPVPDGEPGEKLREVAQADEPLDDAVALLLPTSGSTGSPKVVELSREALVASATATHDRLGGPGTWLLALPLTHVAGWQVLVRSAVAGTVPVAVDGNRGFTAEDFVSAATRLPSDDARYTALVPTQLARLLDDPGGTAALARFDCVLIGGAATPPALLDRAGDAGVAVRTTYGMTETCGGCVYDGTTLDGVLTRVDGDGRVLLAGPVLANGYRNDAALTAGSFVSDRDGTRWFRTNDAGRFHDGRLELLGRLDDVIITGGTNVDPAAVERVLLGLDGVHAAIVIGVPDAEWGRAVVALVVADGTPDLADVRDAVAERLGREAAPRQVIVVPALPLHGIGKPDRAAATRIARSMVDLG